MSAVIDRLVGAVNGYDLEGLVSCFADDYVNETPVHPQRGFMGSEQVRTNWAQIFAGVADMRAAVQSRAETDHEIWTEWDMSGSRREDGGPFLNAWSRHLRGQGRRDLDRALLS
jgi:ketosteroid isomerase-like protein